jgi:hypothetical protein
MDSEGESEEGMCEILEDWTVAVAARSRQGVFLVKVPEWVSEALLAAPEGDVVGHSDEVVIGNSVRRSFRFELTSQSASEFTAMATAGTNIDNLDIFVASEHAAVAAECQGVFNALPIRDAAYKELVRSRAEKSEMDKLNKRKTVLDQRPVTEPAAHNVQMFKYGAAEGGTKRGKGIKGALLRSNLSMEELTMSILVAEDIGWNINQFARRLKEAGGYGVGLKQLKQILTDICEFARRNDDAHPKYYLKPEFKVLHNNS